MKYAIIRHNVSMAAVGKTEQEALNNFYSKYDCYENERPENNSFDTADIGDFLVMPCTDELYVEFLEYGSDVIYKIKNGVCEQEDFDF